MIYTIFILNFCYKSFKDGKISTVLIAAMIESAGRTFFRFYHIPEEIIQTSDDEPVKLKAINETCIQHYFIIINIT